MAVNQNVNDDDRFSWGTNGGVDRHLEYLGRLWHGSDDTEEKQWYSGETMVLERSDGTAER